MDVSPEELDARIQQAALAFDALPPKPPKPSSPRRQIVVTLFDEITRLKKNGYNFDEICQLLVEQTGVEMTPGTLRKYWGAEQRQRQGKKPQRRRSGKSQPSQKSSLPTQGAEEPVKVDKVAEADPKIVDSTRETAVAVKSVTPDDSGDTWPPVGERGSDSHSESDPEPPMEQPESESTDDDDWNDGGDEDDDDSYTSGLIHEPTFNRMRRR